MFYGEVMFERASYVELRMVLISKDNKNKQIVVVSSLTLFFEYENIGNAFTSCLPLFF